MTTVKKKILSQKTKKSRPTIIAGSKSEPSPAGTETNPRVKVRTAAAQPFVTKVAIVEDEGTGDAYDVFSFAKPLGRQGTVAVPKDKSGDIRAVTSYLKLKNAILPASKKASDGLVATAIAASPAEHRLLAHATGWRRPNYFLLGNRVIKTGDQRLKIRSPGWIRTASFRLKRCGTLRDWKNQVAGAAVDSTALMLALCCGFAAYLLRPTGRPSFVINLVGPAKCGKTAALLGATSIAGIGTEAGLPTWNSSGAAIMQTARMFNDSLLPINELGALRKKGSDRAEYIAQLVYALCEGRDATRHTASGFALSAQATQFQVVLFSTAEFSLESLAQETRQDGEVARAHDVPALWNGASTIFGRLPHGSTNEQRDARLKVIALRKACADHHGLAIVKFLTWLDANWAKIPERVNALLGEFAEGIDMPLDDGALLHARDNFGLVYAGGVFAIQAGLAPWKSQQVKSAIRDCFDAFRATVRRSEEIRGHALRVLKNQVQKIKLPSISDPCKLQAMPKTGFITYVGDKKVTVLHSTAFDKLFDSVAEARSALMALDQKGKLLRAAAAKPSLGSKEWAETFVKIGPGKLKFRAIRFTT